MCSLNALVASAQRGTDRGERLEPPELALDGVIVAANPGHSIVLVRRAGATRARPVRVGQDFAGYVLVEVTRDAALFEGARGGFWVSLTESGTTGVVASEATPHRDPEPELLWIRRSFSRTEANRRLEKEIPVILSDTELTPRVVEGEVRGLELLRLPDGTVLSRSGLLPGDVLRSINEEPLSGLDSLWRLLARFSDDDELRLVLERRGEVVRYAYDLTE